MKPLLIGQAPSRTAGKQRAFDGASGRRLARLLGTDLDGLFERFETVNLLRRWPGKHGGRHAYREKGDRFPIAAARRSAQRVSRERFGSFSVVVFCGRRTARAFGVDSPFLEWAEVPGPGSRMVDALVFPHPSGCNLWFNSRENREMAAEKLAEAEFLAAKKKEWTSAKEELR